MEHNPWDIRALRDSLQYMLNRGQIARSGSVAPAVTPMVRIPPNGAEKAQFHAKQALDLGAYGIVWPHISSVDEAYNAVAACRYPRMKTAPLYEPAGLRGDGPTAAVRYWGLSQQDYYDRADVWPLNPKGEVFVILMMEDTRGIEALSDILQKVPGIGAILIGEGDLSRSSAIPANTASRCSNGWRGWLTPASGATWRSAIRTSTPTMWNASSARATASSWPRRCSTTPPSTGLEAGGTRLILLASAQAPGAR
jgi:2-keto-3-deoxy-L-rhamnonate aldolase RhmA